jgi:hypothetical protein
VVIMQAGSHQLLQGQASKASGTSEGGRPELRHQAALFECRDHKNSPLPPWVVGFGAATKAAGVAAACAP